MSFDQLIDKVAQAENAVEAHERRFAADVRQLRQTWKSAWTPGRIVIAGLAGGFLAGRAEPLKTVARGEGAMRVVSLLTTLFATVSATTAATAADDVQQASEDIDPESRPMAEPTARSARVSVATTAADGDRMANDYLERAASAARQGGGTTEP